MMCKNCKKNKAVLVFHITHVCQDCFTLLIEAQIKRKNEEVKDGNNILQ